MYFAAVISRLRKIKNPTWGQISVFHPLVATPRNPASVSLIFSTISNNSKPLFQPSNNEYDLCFLTEKIIMKQTT